MSLDTAVRWPNGARCAVMLTFDVDAEYVWLGMDPGTIDQPSVLSIGRFGPERGIERVLDVLERYGVRATFMVPGRVAELYPGQIKEVVRRGHEIGHHGYEHENYGVLDREQQREVFLKGIDALVRVTGQRPYGWRTPMGQMTADTIRLLHELEFTWTSFMRGDDRPYFLELEGEQTSLVEIPAHWELDDFPYFIYSFDPPFPRGQSRIASYEDVFGIWTSEFDGYYKYGLCYVPMFHPQCIGSPGRIHLLERLLRYITDHPGVWFAIGSEVASFWRESGCSNDRSR